MVSNILERTEVDVGGLSRLLDDSPLADWAWDAAVRYGISPLRALEMMAAALMRSSQRDWPARMARPAPVAAHRPVRFG
jgi:hypothetical protein